MNRDALGLDAVSLLAEIRDELRLLNASLATRPAGENSHTCVRPAPDLIVEIHNFIGGLAKFTASEIVDRADVQLAAAIAGRGAAALGRELAAAEGCTVDGQRLVRAGRGGDGVIWRFC